MNISVLGCGRWGSFIAWYQATVLKNKVINWGPEDDYSYRVLRDEGKNEYVSLDSSIELTCDLEHAVTSSDVIIISISSQGLRGFIRRICAYPIQDKVFVLCMKGIEESTGKRLSEVLIENGIDKDKIAVWVGPGHIQAFTQGIPNCMVIDSYNPALKKRLADCFKSDLIRFYYGNDIIGTEIGAAAKNVLGIAAGVLDGSGYASLKGPLMARGAYEVGKLIRAMGGEFMSAYGLAHLGDYETTLFSEYSHNRKYGEMMAQGAKFSKLAEGVMTAKAMKELADRYSLEMPITEAVYEACFLSHAFDSGDGPGNCKKIILKLFERSTKPEFCMDRIPEFQGEYRFLSNFYDAPTEYLGRRYLNSEAAYQSMKCPSRADEFVNLPASQAKKLGSAMEIRADWEEVKERIMYEVCYAKFTQNPQLGKLLIATGEAYLEEGNDWGDEEWGVCNGKGNNKLGKILMRIRKELKNNFNLE